jgi:hypothetical protein
MLKDPEFRRVAIAAAGGIVLVLLAGWLVFQDTFFRMSVTPRGSFAATPAPPQPDYAKPESWALRPAQPPAGGWETPWGIDTFFIHPTTAYADDDWNTPIDEPVSSERLDNRILPNHAGPFLHAGPVYAPRYRQASLHSEIDIGGEGDGAFLIAYADVLAAFDHYMANDNRGRGVMLVGVGQGGLYAQKLLQDRFQEQPMMDRMVAAWVINAALPADLPEKMFIQPVCATPTAIRCVIAWKTVLAGDDESRFRDRSPVWTLDGKIVPSTGRQLVCVNPMFWNVSRTDLAARSDHRGGARATGKDDLEPQIIPNAVSARCKSGVLEVERPSAPELQARDGWGARYKTPEFNLFYADIVAGAADRARTASVWLDEYAQKPAEPLPPAQPLGDSPIFRDGDPRPVTP